MIKINLLPEPDDSYAIRRACFAGGGATSVAILLLILFQYFLLTSEVGHQKESVSQLQQQLAAVKEKTREVSDLDERKQGLKVMAESIARVKLQQIGPARLLEDLNLAVPERVWLTSLEEGGSRYTIRGIGLNDFAVAAFESALQKRSYVKSADLKETSTVYLTKIISFNTADSAYTYFVIPATRVQDVGRIIKEEAKLRGLQVFTRPPKSSSQKIVNKPGMSGGVVDSTSEKSKKLVGWGRFMKVPDGIYYWNLSEGTEAKEFEITLAYDFLGMKPSDIINSADTDKSEEKEKEKLSE